MLLDLSVCELLISLGADLNAVNPTKGQTPLHCACNGGHVAIVAMLLRHPEVIASINAGTRPSKCTPLHCVAYASGPDAGSMGQLLIDHGALVDVPDTTVGLRVSSFSTLRSSHSLSLFPYSSPHLFSLSPSFSVRCLF